MDCESLKRFRRLVVTEPVLVVFLNKSEIENIKNQRQQQLPVLDVHR
jgi:hypothetical protein